MKLKPGQYFTVVRRPAGADGRHTLSRLTRTITRTRALSTAEGRPTSGPADGDDRVLVGA